jgi:toxin ParE1/3/4
MEFIVYVTVEARLETQDAYTWYEEKSTGLGEELLREIENCYKRISANPVLFGFLNSSRTIRYMLIGRFPYVIIFVIVGNNVNVVSVRHTSRKPYL